MPHYSDSRKYAQGVAIRKSVCFAWGMDNYTWQWHKTWDGEVPICDHQRGAFGPLYPTYTMLKYIDSELHRFDLRMCKERHGPFMMAELNRVDKAYWFMVTESALQMDRAYRATTNVDEKLAEAIDIAWSAASLSASQWLTAYNHGKISMERLKRALSELEGA